uniref:Uncharacterized protein n=1 Tax=Rhizophora mucronata TaxID=61149 RepID=A0A2P2LPL0_RHIMU
MSRSLSSLTLNSSFFHIDQPLPFSIAFLSSCTLMAAFLRSSMDLNKGVRLMPLPKISSSKSFALSYHSWLWLVALTFP